ncbi:MAG: pyruvate ferredoxin oxidoreductase, partial [Dehalococcoidia bacterium]|nr:pyruvate ferredoxin oxidoreductase [Dehalococcoidia bacterium]
MAINLKEMSAEQDLLAPGHRLCAGCAESIVVRQVLHAVGQPVVVASPTGCLEVSTSPYPYTSWRVPWIHSAFENVASTISGVETMYRSLVKQGKMEDKGIKFVVFAG